jgi:hypothetical protein
MMIERKWPHSLTATETSERLGIACCALAKLAQWTDTDTEMFGSWQTFAQVSIEQAMAHRDIIKVL